MENCDAHRHGDEFRERSSFTSWMNFSFKPAFFLFVPSMSYPVLVLTKRRHRIIGPCPWNLIQTYCRKIATYLLRVVRQQVFVNPFRAPEN
jgi:hypothetical protein